jgi:hypothetical protein
LKNQLELKFFSCFQNLHFFNNIKVTKIIEYI